MYNTSIYYSMTRYCLLLLVLPAAGGIYESYGRGWLIKPAAEKDQALKMGDGNTMRLRVAGDHVTTWINGVEMIDLRDEKIGAADGVIALQIHDGGSIKVRWRNLVVREASPSGL